MEFLKDIRVVRGPNWKWGDQDGGVGYTGTIIGVSQFDQKKQQGPKTVDVQWDSGYQGRYRCGPEGYHDLRIVCNIASGVKHESIPCDGDGCLIQEIRGIRWECDICHINLCTSCFFNKTPHNKDHHRFKRYEKNWISTPTIVSTGTDGENDTDNRRIALMGIYPGALVFQGPYWSNDVAEVDERKVGSVIKEESSGELLIRWLSTGKTSRHQRVHEKIMLSLKAAALGGYYKEDTIPVLDIPFRTEVKNNTPSRSTFSPGDKVKIHSGNLDNHGGKLPKSPGTVVKIVSLSDVLVRFNHGRGRERSTCLKSDVLKKLNKFSINESIRIRKDEGTLNEIAQEFGIVIDEPFVKLLDEATGHVIRIDKKNPNRVFINFDDPTIRKRISKDKSLPTGWMEPFEPPCKSQLEKEFDDYITKGMRLFFRAVESGNLQVIKNLYSHQKMLINAQNSTGMTVLQVACQKGREDIVQWLLDDVKVNLEEKNKRNGFRAIHYAVKWNESKVLEMLINRGVQLDSQTECGKTALHFAVSHVSTDCIRLLVKGGCDLNIQSFHGGDTGLHLAISGGISAPSPQTVISILVSSDRIDWKLRNKKGFNVLHVAVLMGNLKAIECILKKEDEDLALEAMPDPQSSTVLHFACARRNFIIVQVLLNHFLSGTMKIDGRKFIPSQLHNLLLAKNKGGMTALLVACKIKDPALIEHLVTAKAAAGENLEDVDREGRTAIILSVSSEEEDRIPTEKLSPKIFKLYETIRKKTTGSYAILLSLVSFLLDSGCCWEATDLSGVTAHQILLDKGCPLSDILMIKARSNAKNGRNAPVKKGLACVGLGRKCPQPPTHQISCPHKAPYNSCFQCIVNNTLDDEFKCGCKNKKSSPVFQQMDVSSSNTVMEDSKLNIVIDDDISVIFEKKHPDVSSGLKWADDNTPYGFILDRSGFKFEPTGSPVDGVMIYRCTTPCNGFKEKRCTALAQMVLNSTDRTSTITLVSSHDKHPKRKRQSDDCASGSGGPSATKRKEGSLN